MAWYQYQSDKEKYCPSLSVTYMYPPLEITDTDHLTTVQYSAGKPRIVAFMSMQFEKNHPPVLMK